jgi:small subunit ribosomal protein S5
VHELLAELERKRQREHEDHRKEGKEEDGNEDYMGIKPLLKKIKRFKAKETTAADKGFWEPTYSDSNEDDEAKEGACGDF